MKHDETEEPIETDESIDERGEEEEALFIPSAKMIAAQAAAENVEYHAQLLLLLTRELAEIKAVQAIQTLAITNILEKLGSDPDQVFEYYNDQTERFMFAAENNMRKIMGLDPVATPRKPLFRFGNKPGDPTWPDTVH